MSRKPTNPPTDDTAIDEARFRAAHQVMVQDAQARALSVSQHEAAVRAVALQVGYQLPADCADPDLIQRDISANMRRSVEACLEVGRGLAVLKQACEHGNFVARLEVLGLDRTVAVRFMQAAVKFSNVATSQHLIGAIGTQSKLFELLVLDDDQVEELTLTGQTGELSLDDIASMSVKELRAALREARAEGKAKDELLAEKNKTIDRERANAKRIREIPPDETLAELRKAVAAIADDARGAIVGQLREGLATLFSHHDKAGGDSVLWAAGIVGQLVRDIDELRDQFGLPDVTDAVVPEWVEQ